MKNKKHLAWLRYGSKTKKYQYGGLDLPSLVDVKQPNLQEYLSQVRPRGIQEPSIGPPIAPLPDIGIGNTQIGLPQYLQGTPSAVSSKKKSNFSLGTAANFFDNAANLVAASETPNLPIPITTPGPRLNTNVNINPELRRISDDVSSFNRGVDISTSSAGVASANKGKALTSKLRAIGDLESNKRNLESQLQNRQAVSDYQAKLQNNQLLNQTNLNQTLRRDDINRRYADVFSNVGSDIANINREKNLQNLDLERIKVISKMSPDVAYQFADTQMFKDLYKNDKKGLRDIILKQKGSVPKSKLMSLYKELFNEDFDGTI